MSIKDLPSAMRPREKMLALGPAALSDAELLALLLRTGTPEAPVLALAHHMLERFEGLRGLLHAPPAALQAVKGLGPAKRAELAAILELARRSLAEQLRERAVFDNPKAVKDYLALHLRSLPYELFAVLWLDSQNRLIEMREMFKGTLAQTSVYPREVVREAIRTNAAAVILAHNHPSGIAEPSRADAFLTERLKAALALIDVRVLDHLVVGGADVISFAERGLL